MLCSVEFSFIEAPAAAIRGFVDTQMNALK
jgi:hypothetical protein